ncbi:MAG: GNAT family protein [Patescibacteria group bacterium]|nr:GNAT family protein [Patescibacteria group bacterium]
MRRKDKIIFLKGEKVILRPLRKNTDLEKALRWINDPEVNQYLSIYFPINDKKEEEWFDGLYKNDDNLPFAIETLDGKFIGVIGLHRINWKDRVATTGALIGEKDYWGKGYGTDAKMTLLNYAFNALNLRKICSAVIEYNKRSLRYSLHCGYKIEGCWKKQIFKKGKYWDEILLGIFRKDWLKIWRKYEKTGRIK